MKKNVLMSIMLSVFAVVFYSNANEGYIMSLIPACKYKTATTSKLRDHIRSHTQERRLACSHCGILVCSATRLEDHQKRQSHGGIAKYILLSGFSLIA